MKKPIKPEDIRKGDRIRVEGNREHPYKFSAVEYTAQSDGDLTENIIDKDAIYLLDRPKPKVDLPTEPTLGWLTANGQTGLAAWRPALESGWWGSSVPISGSREYCFEWRVESGDVTAFTPAVAVPKAALDDLEAAIGRWQRDAGYRFLASEVAGFLAAVDEANS